MRVTLAMQTQYVKRFRMEIDFRKVTLSRSLLPAGYQWQAWNANCLEAHASAKFDSFRHEFDSQMFECLSTLSGCTGLMKSIAQHRGFLPQATWLIQQMPTNGRAPFPCGTIQGIAQSSMVGAIQNVGIHPAHRGIGLGKALLLKSLWGFRGFGLLRVYLDVTADNQRAVDLYQSVGFRTVSTSYREVILTMDAEVF